MKPFLLSFFQIEKNENKGNVYWVTSQKLKAGNFYFLWLYKLKSCNNIIPLNQGWEIWHESKKVFTTLKTTFFGYKTVVLRIMLLATAHRPIALKLLLLLTNNELENWFTNYSFLIACKIEEVFFKAWLAKSFSSLYSFA